MRKLEKDILKKIKKLRKKLNISIKQKGIQAKDTREISQEIDKTINKYYSSIKTVEYPENSKMKLFYIQSYLELKKLTQRNHKFPTTKEWDIYANKNEYANHITLEYISKLEWNYLQIRIEREIKMEKNFGE